MSDSPVDSLIDSLAADLRPVSRGAVPMGLLLALVVGLVAAAAVMVPWLGLRSDYPQAFLTPTFWGKFAFTALLMLAGFLAALSLARPNGRLRGAMMLAFAVIAVTGGMGLMQVMLTHSESVRALVMGGTALVCPFYIAILSVPIHIVTTLAMRRFAPTNLPAAGFAAGLLAGGAASFVYAFHCGENGLPFITLWYTAGVLIPAFVGALIGRWTMRW